MYPPSHSPVPALCQPLFLCPVRMINTDAQNILLTDGRYHRPAHQGQAGEAQEARTGGGRQWEAQVSLRSARVPDKI